MRFGTLAAITANGQNVTASASGETATVTFKPNADGSFRVICGAPTYNGSTAAATTASTLLGSDATTANLDSTHTALWHGYWASLGLVKDDVKRRDGRLHRELDRELAHHLSILERVDSGTFACRSPPT